MKHRSFFAGLLATVLAVMVAVLVAVTNEGMFTRAVVATVDGDAIGATSTELRAFASNTIKYIRGDVAEWSPALSLYGVPASEAISPAFTAHMAEVRTAVFWAQRVALCVFIGILALWFLPTKGEEKRIRRRFYYLGMLAPLVLVAAVGAWAAADFNGLWRALHEVFIPGGIFNASEPAMALFPLQAFSMYLAPTCAAMLGVLVIAAAVVWLDRRGIKHADHD